MHLFSFPHVILFTFHFFSHVRFHMYGIAFFRCEFLIRIILFSHTINILFTWRHVCLSSHVQLQGLICSMYCHTFFFNLILFLISYYSYVDQLPIRDACEFSLWKTSSILLVLLLTWMCTVRVISFVAFTAGILMNAAGNNHSHSVSKPASWLAQHHCQSQ